MRQLGADKAIKRLFEGDASLWTNDPAGQEEIRRRLSWLRLPTSSLSLSDELESFAKEVLNAGFTYALLLGMGGSSLASEVIRTIFGNKKDGTHNIPGLDFAILDSTDPRQVKAAARRSAI